MSNISFRSEDQNFEVRDEESLDLRQCNPSFENITDDELFNVAKSVEHAQVINHHEKVETPIIQPEVSQNDESKSK